MTVQANERMDERMNEQDAVQAAQTEEQEESVQVAVDGKVEVQTPVTNAAKLPAELLEVAQLIKELGGAAAVKESLELMKANRDEARQELIAELTANQWCAFSAEELRQMSNVQLTKLAQSLRVPDFAGRGGMRTQEAQGEWESYHAPATQGK